MSKNIYNIYMEQIIHIVKLLNFLNEKYNDIFYISETNNQTIKSKILDKDGYAGYVTDHMNYRDGSMYLSNENNWDEVCENFEIGKRKIVREQEDLNNDPQLQYINWCYDNGFSERICHKCFGKRFYSNGILGGDYKLNCFIMKSQNLTYFEQIYAKLFNQSKYAKI